jgi:hypothetical protein
MTEEQTERFRLFYYENVHDPATKYGYMAADIFLIYPIQTESPILHGRNRPQSLYNSEILDRAAKFINRSSRDRLHLVAAHVGHGPRLLVSG